MFYKEKAIWSIVSRKPVLFADSLQKFGKVEARICFKVQEKRFVGQRYALAIEYLPDMNTRPHLNVSQIFGHY